MREDMSEENTIVEEEYLVYAELCDNTDPNIFSHAETNFKSFALDSSQPILTIGGQAFVGKYKDTVGTAVFLEEIPPGTSEQIGFGNEPSDPLFVDSPSKKLKYVCHTRKTLEMSRVLLIEKKKQGHDLGNIEENKECIASTEVSGEEQEDENSACVDEPTNLNIGSINTCVGSPKMELQRDDLPLTTEEGQMAEDIEKMKIISHSDK